MEKRRSLQLFVTPRTVAHPAPLFSAVSHSCLIFVSTESVMPSNHLILCRPLLILPQSFTASMSFPMSWLLVSDGQIAPFYWSYSFSISPSSEYSGLISFRIDWFYLLAVQGTLKSLLQHHNLKVWILQCSAFFMIQFSHLCITTGKTTALTMQTFVDKVLSLLFNTLSRFVITFLRRSKCLWISWLQSQSAVILKLKKIKSVTASTSPLLLIFAMKWWDQMPWC